MTSRWKRLLEVATTKNPHRLTLKVTSPRGSLTSPRGSLTSPRGSLTSPRTVSPSTRSPTGRRLSRVAPPINTKRTSVSQQVDREKDNELREAQGQVEQLKEQLEAEKTKFQEQAVELDVASLDRTQLRQQLERSQGNASKLREENRVRQEKINKLERQVSIQEDRLRSLDAKGTEVEKLELMLETLRNRLDNSQCETREKVQELKTTRRDLQDTTTKLQTAEKSIEALTIRVDDLKEQVKEELARNDLMEQKLVNLSELREQVRERDEQVAALQAEIDQKQAVLSHARMTLREEREKLKELRSHEDERDTLQEELALTRAEALTLKRLLIGKDTLLVQKTQALDLAKELIRELDQGKQTTLALQYLDQPRALYPQGAHFNDPDKKQCLTDGSIEDFDKINKQYIADVKPRKGVRSMLDASRAVEDSRLAPGDRHQSNHNNLLDTILRDEQQKAAYPHRPATSKPMFQTHGGMTGGAPFNYTQNDPTSPQRRPKTAVVKPQIYHTNQTFANFRTATNSETENKRQVRLKLQNQRGESQSAAAGSKSRARVKASWMCSGTQGLRSESGTSKLSRNTSSVWGEEMSVYERDTLASKFVHLGDRVIIDLSTKKGEKEKLSPGVVRFVGQVDKEVEDFRIYIGVKMDEPVGDMDGVYKGKRYFTAPEKSSKMVKIHKVKAVLHAKASNFKSLSECIENYLTLAAGGSSSTSIKSRIS